MTQRVMRSVLSAAMAVILAVTSLTMAVARGETRMGTEIVICTGYGITTVTVDEEGNPTGPVHLCPDMVLGMMAALDTPPPVFTRPEGRVERIEPVEPVQLRGTQVPQPRARDPPAVA